MADDKRHPVSIDGLGDVPSVGVKTVTPTESTTYHLVARDDDGSDGCLGARNGERDAFGFGAEHPNE